MRVNPTKLGLSGSDQGPRLIGVKRRYCFHYRDKDDVIKPCASVPLRPLLEGFFLSKVSPGQSTCPRMTDRAPA
jgi:hypothetical protein